MRDVNVWRTSLTHNVFEKVALLTSFFQLCREKKAGLLWNGYAVGEFVEKLAIDSFTNVTSNPVLTV